MAVGIKEIAKDLNLGLSTVAHALSGKGTLSLRTRQLVLDHAAKVGYTPNRNAQRMRQARTGVIGLIVPDVVLSPYVEVVQHLFQMAKRRGKELQIALTEFYREQEDLAFRSMLASRVDGIIAKVGFPRWEDVPPEHYLQHAKAEGIPIVLYSNPIEGSGLPYLTDSLPRSTRLVVRHLLGLGHRRIAALAPASRPFQGPMQDWLTVIREELAASGNGTELIIAGLPEGQVSHEGSPGVFRDYMMNQNHPGRAAAVGRQLFRAAMAAQPRPTALVAYTDVVAIGAIFEAQAHGLRIGAALAIAGCGQVASSFLTPISLTTVDRRPQLYAQKLWDLLEQHMDANTRASAPLTDQIEPLLVIGASTVGE